MREPTGRIASPLVVAWCTGARLTDLVTQRQDRRRRRGTRAADDDDRQARLRRLHAEARPPGGQHHRRRGRGPRRARGGPVRSIGFSGGGPPSLACAALLPGRCLAAPRCGVAPSAPGLDFLAGIEPENVEEFSLARPRRRRALAVAGKGRRRGSSSIEGDQIIASLGGLISGADAACSTGFADDLARSLRGAIREGIAGWRDNDLAFRPTGIQLDPVRRAGRHLAGRPGRDGPVRARPWLAAPDPQRRPHLEPGAGALT